MAIRINFPAEAPPPVELESHPLTELVLSLRVVANPRRHAGLAPFVRRARSRLPKPVARELSDLSSLLGPPAPAPAAFVFPARESAADLAQALAALSPRDEGLLPTLEIVGGEALPERRRHGESRRRIVAELARDPLAVAERLLRLLADYHAYAFDHEWPELDARLRLAHVDAELELARGGIGALLLRTSRRARLASHGIAVTPTLPVDVDVELPEDGTLPVVLSLFSAPYVITRIAPAAGLVLPAPVPDRRVSAPSLSLVQELDAFADPTRLTLLRLVAGQPRSTRELSQLVGISESGISKHMRRLAAAELVRGERNGYYVLYSLVPERAVAASDALLDFLHVGNAVSTDSPPG